MSKRKSVDLLPVIFRTESNERFLSGTLDQLIQQPNLKKVDGYIGNRTVKTFDPSSDSYINSSDLKTLRQQYEVEPGIVIRNPVTDKVEFSKTYEDILNSLQFYGANISNQDKMFKQQSYSWNPHIDLDKFINYRNYVWLPSGPPTIIVTGKEKKVISTITVKIVEDENGLNWNFSNNSVAVNPTLTLYRGMTYIFEVDSVDQPFFIKSKRTSGSQDIVTGNVTNNGSTNGSVVFEVNDTTPATLYYVSGKDYSIFGKFLIRNKTDNTTLDVNTDILGKKEYEIVDGVKLSNGMKIKFTDTVEPASYRDKAFIVEGVGNSITLVDYEKLLTIESYATSVETSFDSESFDEFPFDQVSEYPIEQDYILINRASKDKNPWSRYNRWFHIDVVTTSSDLNNVEPEFDETARASRPIIEFTPNIQLFNFASNDKKYVNFLDDNVKDAFSEIEGSTGFYIDGVKLEHGNRVVFTVDSDPEVKNKVYEVKVLDINGVKKIHLETTQDSAPIEDQGLLVTSGLINGRSSWIYKNSVWVRSQQKTELNQAPLFDIFDDNGISLSTYKESSFTGSKVFGYAIGTGNNDDVLGFPIKYSSVANVGGYLFDNFYNQDTFTYFNTTGELITHSLKNCYLRINNDSVVFENNWIKTNKPSMQEIIEQKIAVGGEDSLQFTSINVNTKKYELRIFKNGKQLLDNEFTVGADIAFDAFYINFATVLIKDDVILLRALPIYDKTSDGFYETPINLVNNPLNDSPMSVSYAEINDHLNSIILNASKDLGFTIDQNNLRDNLLLEKYGRRFVQHEGLVAMAGAVLTDKDINVISSIRWAALEYQRYKTAVLQKFVELSSYTSMSDALDKIIADLAKDKTQSSTFYYSDMLPYGENRRDYEYTVKDSVITAYAYGSVIFNKTELGNKAILVYLNGNQLLHGVDYTFDLVDPLIRFTSVLAIGDKILIKFYNNIYGACMPMSPTKLGLYPSFIPEIYLDNTYIEPTNVIQGHDGSITVAYGDDRDLLLLELEKRIHNNLNSYYDARHFDINDVVPGIFRNDASDITRINESIEEEFLRWTGLFNVDFSTNANAVFDSPFSYNFVNAVGDLNPDVVLNGSWRKIYKYFYDTDRPHTHPWEMLGFFSKPTWWESEYGPAPYTSGNKYLWDDLESGYIRQGNRTGYATKYARPGLSNIIPVDSYGDLIDPIAINVVRNYDYPARYQDWKFGDMGPAESAWRRSQLYPFAIQIAMALTLPAKYLTVCFDTSRNTFNKADQLVYKDTAQRFSTKTVKVYGDKSPSFVLATGYSPYLVEHLRLRHTNPSTIVKNFINRIESNLIYKVGGFTSKDKFRVALETVTTYKTVDKVFIPEENYQIALNVGSPIKTLAMSGIIVERGSSGFVIRGYDSINPYFKIFKTVRSPSDPIVQVGGISETFIYWASNANVTGGTIVANGQKYYRAVSTHLTSDTFNSSLYYPLPYLPTVGGVEAFASQSFESNETVVPYGTSFNSIQDVYDFIRGYGAWLTAQGFLFETPVAELEVVANWDLAGKEFLFWSIQNWAENSIISLAPFAGNVVFASDDSVVDDIYDTFYDYTLLKSDGTAIDKNKISIAREEGKFTITTDEIANDGVYFVKINLVQKEHVLVFDNFTIFNDLIYQPYSGYRQNRFKVNGFVTDGWQGDFYIPGFVYDSAKIDDWQPDIDYSIGDVVKFQTKYYQANSRLLPSGSFNYENWTVLGKQPIAQLLPNFEYKISQFEDFYSLDAVNFDDSQQKFAQKLIGYVPRKYLNSLIYDQTSQYKFYQGFIREKGTTLPLEKFSVAHNTATGSHVSLQEEWAFRLGIFGGENIYKEVEFSLDQNKFTQDPQLFEFEWGNTKAESQRSYVITPSDVLIKPNDFNGNPWPTLLVDSAQGTSYNQYQKLPTAGYPRIDDVTFTALYENNLLTLSSISSIKEGDTVWIAMNNKSDWTVKRYSLAPARIISYNVDGTNSLIEFITDVAHNLSLRDFVATSKLEDPLNTIYEVVGITSPTSFVVATNFNDIQPASGLLNGLIYFFANVRFKNYDDVAKIDGLARWSVCEFVWVDDDGTGNWVVLEKEDSAIPVPLRPYTDAANQHFGNTTIIAPVSQNIIVSATNQDGGRVYVYNREVIGSTDIQLNQSYLLEENVSDVLTVQTVKNGIVVPAMPRNHGFSIDCWESSDLDTRYIVSGAPNSTNAKWVAPGFSLSNSPLKKPMVFGYSSSGYFDEGSIKLTKWDTDESAYVTEVVLASPIPQSNAKFGHKVKFIGNTSPILLVSSPGQDRQGSVFVYYLDVNNVWQVYTENNIAFDLRSKIVSLNEDSQFGLDIASSKDGNTVVISAPGYLKDRTQAHSGAVFIFRKDPATFGFNLVQTLYADDYLQVGDLILKGVVQTYDPSDIVMEFSTITNSLTRNSGSFIQDGFRIGQTIAIAGSNNNNYEFVIAGMSVTQLTFKEGIAVIDEIIAETITITGLGTARDDKFGDKVSMNDAGDTLIVASDHASQSKLDAGLVYVMKLDSTGRYVLSQRLVSPSEEPGELFGSNVTISPNGDHLLVTAIGGAQSSSMWFDSYTNRIAESANIYGSEYVLDPKSSLRPNRTTFDSNSTRFNNKAKNSGSVYLYSKLGNNYVYGESLVSGDSASVDGYGTGIATNGNFHVVGAPKYDLKVVGTLESTNTLTTYPDAGTVILFDKKQTADDCGCGSSWSWSKVRSQEGGLVDVDKIKKVITYNNNTFNILENYEIFDPVKGKIPAKVTEEIKYITPFDPAVYTVAVATNSNVRVDNKTTWTSDHVGELWLDTSTLRYMWYEQGSEDFRINNWGKLFPGSTVDVYEWVKSDYRPSEWSTLADTEEGLSLGISGQPKNPDNSVVSINQFYDPVINDFVNVYYFWVRNKITIPDLSFRSISSYECARIIEDPKTQGIKYASFLSPKSLSLTNTKRDLDSSKINVDIYYQDSDVEVNRHSHWQLINENNQYFKMDSSIENKLFDSLVGQDTLGNLVPDPMLSPKLKYGTMFRPRQSWFKNREAALKTMIDYTNSVLATYDVVGKVDLTDINKFDPVPLESDGYYDEIVETSDDVFTIGTSSKTTAEITATVINGRVTSVNITNPGFGYKIAPTVEIYGDGSGAKLQTVINLSGNVVGVMILSQGSGYTTAPRILVRSYSVLASLDVAIDRWAIYYLVDGAFQRKISQTYDTRKYWSYVDWVDTSYSADIPPKYTLNYLTDLEAVIYEIGDTVEIRNTGDGRNIILRKTAIGLGNYIDDYDLVFREQGTIQFSNKLYDKSLAGIGFDTFIRYDQNSYDETLATELRMILESIKNHIFVGELAVYWNKFIFVAVRYVLSEQLFVDWVFKTSLITPIIDAGTLSQQDIYRFNDYSYVEEFIKEIKPFKSKFREITVTQNATESVGVGVTDFDLPAYVDSNGFVKLADSQYAENNYPFKHWYDHKGMSVKAINIAEAGANYRLPPDVVIVAAANDLGSGATAEARLSNGKLSEIVVTNPGSGYLTAPRIVLVGGGNYTDTFVAGRASAMLANNKVRSNEISMKFDRTSEKGLFTGEYYNRNFTTDGSTLSYALTYPQTSTDDNYPALQDKDTISVFVNDVEMASDTYRITFRPDLSTVITFNVALPANQDLRIQYIKNILYTQDIFNQVATDFKDTFKLTFPPVLDNQKIIVTLVNTTNNTGSSVSSSDYIIQLKQEMIGYRKYVGYIKFKNVPSAGSRINVQYAKNINIQNAVDRIITSYEPTAGMPGKDITQLMKGVEFGGVEIQGLNFTVSSGWDGLPWFSQGWDSFVNEYNDLLVISDGVTLSYDLGYVPLSGTKINVYFAGVRVDDENFGTLEQSNANALFGTIIANGSSSTITLPQVPASGVKIDVRQTLSDGVTLPTDELILDTNLSGGDFTTISDAGEIRFKTATGLRPDDISVDGGQFLSVEHSPAPEELVRGEIFDALSISVFSSVGTGSNLITTHRFQYDGSRNSFTISGTIDSTQNIEVYIGNFVANRNTDYTISQTTTDTTIILTTNEYGLDSASTTNNVIILIQKTDIGGENILDRLSYVVTAQDAAAATFDIVTPVNFSDIGDYYLSTNKTSSLVKVSSRSKRAKITVNNTSPKLTTGTLITILLFGSSVKSYSEIYNQEITITQSTSYTLDRPPGNIEPLHVMASVTRLTPATLHWRGVWEENVEYLPDDSIIYNNVSYVCKLLHNSIQESTNIVFPNWAIGTTYISGDIVIHSGAIYICKTDNVSTGTGITTSNPLYWSLHSANRPDQDSQSVYWEAIPSQRMLPPETEYYEVSEDSQTFALGENVPYLTRTLSIADIEVYKNGKILVANRDFVFDNVFNNVKLSSGITQIGDVIAITVLRNAEFYIRNGNIVFTTESNIHTGQKIQVTTYTNHDQNLMRREVFKGIAFNNEYRLSRPVYSINNVWVDLNGSALTPSVDFTVLTSDYIKLSNRFLIENTDRIVVTSISDLNSKPSMAYRIFKDMTNNTQYKRIGKENSASLTANLYPTDREIYVNDGSIFGNTVVNISKPGVLFIGGERIEFRSINGNVLSGLQRGTGGTGVSELHIVNSKVFSVPQLDTIPYREGLVVNTFTTPNNYRFNATTNSYQNLINDVWTNVASVASYTLTEFKFNDFIPYEDQVSVNMAGKLLVKPARGNNQIIEHDFSITYDSDEVNSLGITGDVEVLPDFTITKSNGVYTLNINPDAFIRNETSEIIANLQIKVVQKIGKIWYTLDGKNTLQQESTVQARFIQEYTAELPDKYYYGQLDNTILYITDENGLIILDETGKPTELE
jgi:hypothetical protein